MPVLLQKSVLKVICLFGGLLIVDLLLLRPSTMQAETLLKPLAPDIPASAGISSSSAEAADTVPTTVFGGVGRKSPAWRAGIDLSFFSTPHYSAFRNVGLSNYVIWGEWRYDDRWGVKGLFSEQSFRMFGPENDRPKTSTRHLGFLAKTWHSLSEDWKASAGIGLAKTELTIRTGRSGNNTDKSGISLVTEFRMGAEVAPDLWLEAGMLTFDSSSGSGSGDQRLGSSGYLLGLSYGFK